jgi:predicted nuclease of predicted toxin-antitoxin system
LADEPVRLLYDQNLAVSLVTSLAGSYQGAAHVRGEGLSTASDRAIWEYARDHGFAIVTKDVDFLRLSALLGAPPKVIWIGLGNCPTADVIRVFEERRAEVEAFLSQEEADVLTLW